MRTNASMQTAQRSAAATCSTELTCHLPTTPRRTRLFHGWIMLPIAMIAFIATAPGQTFGVSLFNESFRTSLNLSHSQLAFAYMLGTFLASLPMGLIGAMMDRFGLRITMTITVIIFGLGCMVTALASGMFTIFLGFLMLRMFGQGALGLLSGNTLAFWFDKKLGTVEGIRHVGMAACMAIFPIMVLFLIHNLGWRWTYVALGVMVWIIMLPLMFFFRNRPEDIGQLKDGLPPANDEQIQQQRMLDETSLTLRQAVRTFPFWVMAALVSFWGMSSTGILFNIVPLFATHGLTETHAAQMFSAFAISLALIYFVGGILADYLPLHLLMAASAAAMIAVMTLLCFVASPLLVILTGIAMGVSQGLLVCVSSPFWARYYGRKHIGKIRGSLATIMVASTSVGPMIMGLSIDYLQSYQPILIAFVILASPLVILSLLATPPARSAVKEIANDSC